MDIVVPPIEGISAVEQITPHEQRQVTLFQKVEDWWSFLRVAFLKKFARVDFVRRKSLWPTSG